MNEQEKKDLVYVQLADEESKFIFQNKILFNETQDYSYIQNITERYLWGGQGRGVYYPDEEIRVLQTVQERGQKIIIFGAGFQGIKFLHICKEQCVHVEYFCDNSMIKQNIEIEGVMVSSLQEILEELPIGQCAFIISPEFERDQIRDFLIENGVPEDHIYLYNKPYFADQMQYFEEGIIKLEDKEVFVDGGCLDLRTSETFLKRVEECGYTADRVYAFEPDKDNLRKCEEKITEKAFHNVSLIDAGLWEADTYLGFLSGADAGSHIVEEINDENQIRVTTIDSSIGGKVTFIKMDIEGAELEALKGAKNCILKFKPKLAICIYHKREDMWEIPLYIKTLVPEYKLYIRHYSNLAIETVLYAVI